MEQSFSQQALLDALRDIRLPEAGAGGLAGELLVCAGLAALAAALVTGLINLIFRRQKRTRPLTLSARLAALDTLPDPQRRVALLYVLRDHAPDRYDALSDALYAPQALDVAHLEAEVQRLV